QTFDLTAPGAKYTIQTLAAGSIAATAATLNGRLGGDLEGKSIQVKFQYGKTAAYGAETSPQTMPSIGDFSANISNLEPGALYHFRALGTVTLATGEVTIYGSELTFTTLTQPPSVTTDAASDVSADGATLNGTLTGMGGVASVNVSFEWGPTALYGFHTIPQPPMTQTGAFEFDLKGLAPGKLYHFRAKAISTAGASYGSDRSFTTLTTAPTVTTVSATNISGDSAILNGFLDSLGGTAGAQVWFQYGKTSGNLDKTTTVQTKNVSGPFNATVTSLDASAKYYFRAVAQNANGTAEGVERSFTTSTVLTGIVVTPSDPSIALGEKQQFEAEGTYSDGNKKDLTKVVAWAVNPSGIAVISTTGLATSVGKGTTTITASYGGKSGTTTLTVTDATQTGLTILPANPSVAAGNTLQFTAIARFSDGTTQVVTGNCVWESLTPAVAEVQATPGLVEAKAQGQATIRATYNGTIAQTTLTVTAATLRSVQIDDIYPAVDGIAPAVGVGGNLQLSLTGTKSDGSTTNLTAAATGTVWVSLNPGIASVSKDGRVTGMTAGTATIKATNKGESDDISIIVTRPPVVTAGGATGIDTDKATLHGFLVNRGTATTVEVSFEYGTTTGGPYTSETTSTSRTATGAFSADLTGLEENTPYFFRAKAVGDGTSYSPELRFKTSTHTEPPQVDTGDAAGTFTSHITTTSAKLYGNLSNFGTAGAGNVAASFEWGLTTAYGNETAPQVMNDTVDFTADLGGLIPKTTYHFRAKAIGDGVDSGEDKTFKTSDVPPAVITNPATRIKPDSAVLNGRLDNPGTAASVSISFEWGLTAAYGNSTPSQPMAKRGDFEALISGLDPSQTYHFRTKAVGDGTVFGADRTFTTDTILTGITVTPNPATIDVGNTQQFTARALTLMGEPMWTSPA
ncbi:MAG: Ig-like domain-containing protein, partial [Dehalococcoidia bacterium]